MKALTLRQPWATLVAIGAKRIETRSWRTSYRGPLAIHAAKGYPRSAQMTAISSPFIGELNGANYLPDIPLASVVATCRLSHIVPIQNIGCTILLGRLGEWNHLLTDREIKFGDYSDGRYAWILEDVQMFEDPMPARGALSLWDWERPSVAALERTK